MSDYDELQAGTDPMNKAIFPAKVKCNISFARGVTTDTDYVYVSVYNLDSGYEVDSFPMSISRNRATGSIALPSGYEYELP